MAFLFYVFLCILQFMPGNSVQIINTKYPTFKLLTPSNQVELDWWQTGVIYEIYPRSFKDTNGDGVGDLKGVIEKIPYLKDLGIDVVWLTPIFSSPGRDLGYDIEDYEQIDELMGTMADFEELVTKLHENEIKIILDFVPNHTSDKHNWFRKSVKKEYPYTDYYVWVNEKYDQETGIVYEPNNWISIFKWSMWEWNEDRKQYYLHQFFRDQPDLNFRNEMVHDEIKNVLRFWLNKNVDGFRVDAIQYLYEREDLQDAPMGLNGDQERSGYTLNFNEMYDVTKQWRAVLDEYKKKDGKTRLLAIESYNSVYEDIHFYGDKAGLGAHFPLNLTLMYICEHKFAKHYVDSLTAFLRSRPKFAWISWNLGNHDNSRPTTRLGKILADGIQMMQMLLPGTPVIYFGDELGMTDNYLRKDQLVDVASILGTHQIRENYRTPFHWDSTAQAGFSTKTKPWLPVNSNYVTVNVEFQKKAERSHLKMFKELVKLRKLNVFRSGYVTFYEISSFVFAFSRNETSNKWYFVVINLGSQMEKVNLKKLDASLSSNMKVLVVSLYAEQNIGDLVNSKSFTLRPKAAIVLESCSLFNR